jgi:hypothetical protein
VFLVDGVDGALESLEEILRADEGRWEIDGVAELVDWRRSVSLAIMRLCAYAQRRARRRMRGTYCI